MPKIQLTGNQSDFLKTVVAAAGRGDLETVRQLLDDNHAWIHTVGSLRSDDAVGSRISRKIGDGPISPRTRCRYQSTRMSSEPARHRNNTGLRRTARRTRPCGRLSAPARRGPVDIHTAAYLG